MSARRLQALDDQRGVTLVELLLSLVIFLIVVTAMGSLYVSTQKAFDYGSAQAFVQQQGTLVQEEVARRLLPAVEMTPTTCGPGGASPTMQFRLTSDEATRQYNINTSLPWSRFRCLYQLQDSSMGDTFPKLYVCRLGDDQSVTNPTGPTSTACSSGTKDNLLVQATHVTGTRLGAQLRVSSTTFTPVSAVGTYTMTSQSMDIRFDLTDGTLFNTQTGQTGLRFGFNVTVRN